MAEKQHVHPPEVPVLCYPNSGSSLVAGVLHRLGVNMGGRLKQAQQVNPLGLYEDEAFSNILGKIWFRYNISPGYRRRIDQERLLAIGARYQAQLAAVIRQRQKPGGAWGVKEPRLSLLWPLLTPYLQNPRWIVAGRDIERMTRSRHAKLNRRFSRHRLDNIVYYIRQGHYFTILSYLTNSLRFFKISREELQAVIAHYYDLLDAFVADKKHLKIYYEKLIQHPEEEIDNIIRFLSIEPDQSRIAAAVSFVRPALRHF